MSEALEESLCIRISGGEKEKKNSDEVNLPIELAGCHRSLFHGHLFTTRITSINMEDVGVRGRVCGCVHASTIRRTRVAKQMSKSVIFHNSLAGEHGEKKEAVVKKVVKRCRQICQQSPRRSWGWGGGKESTNKSFATRKGRETDYVKLMQQTTEQRSNRFRSIDGIRILNASHNGVLKSNFFFSKRTNCVKENVRHTFKESHFYRIAIHKLLLYFPISFIFENKMLI
ncbi:hypothetical protein CEXT_525861 [Caerostris extrusa]|uniref:Uncharacterized protein n=1 Tax=Caerostris extrusa TaxID=172846 RepID=A0AAV4PGR5_CAEEX|nr:hypothetical protein CEXT_525861 [Caerostris extrusa]